MHCGTLLVAEAECCLLSLDAEKFSEVISPFPSRHASRYAACFVEQLNLVDRNSLSDLWIPDFNLLAAQVPEFEKAEPMLSYARRKPHPLRLGSFSASAA